MAMAYITRQNGKKEDWKSHIRQQIEDDLNRRVRDALETPPLERLRRRQLQNQAKAAAAMKSDSDDLNAHLDLTQKEKEFMAARRQHTRLKLQARADSVPDLTRAEETYNRYINQRFSHHGEMLDGEGRVYHGEGYQQRPRHVQTSGCSMDEWEFATGQRVSSKPTYPGGSAPIVAHPKFRDIINPDIEPFYTSIPPAPVKLSLPSYATKSRASKRKVPGAKTFENQITPYTQKWRGICIVYDSEKSKTDEMDIDPPRNPLYAPHLLFESRFESGNLRQARRVGQFEYELVLKSDVFTKRHTQWYYFRVRNMIPGVIYKFRIINLLKKDSLYNQGMMPLLYSERNAEENNIGWIRHGHHISYGRNVQHTICPLLSRELAYYELEWQMEFPHESDNCYLAHCYPYSYTDLKNDLDNLVSDPVRSQYTKREIMCETKAGNNCYLLTVTNFDCRAHKKYVVVSARVHPGESNASWMLKGLVDFITGGSKEAAEIRKKFVFKIVPMLNPDGVIVGNYRCSLQARDLNRNYRHPRRDNFPTVFHIKRLIEDLGERGQEVFVYCDFHGHSRRPNVFMYGNNTSSADAGNVRAFLDERMLPFCISRVGGELFHFESCKFQIRRCKESTGRVVMYKHYNIKNSFTMEATFSGTVIDKNNCRHFNQRDFMNAGKYFAQGVLEYSCLITDKQKETAVILDLTKTVTQQIISASKLDSTEQAAIDIEAVLSSQVKAHTPSHMQELANGDAKPSELSSVDAGKRATVIKVLDTITEETIAKCINLLERLSLPSTVETECSESSDSDSESEPEVPEEKKKKKKQKAKKKKDKKQVKSTIPSIGDRDKKDASAAAGSTLPAADKQGHKHRTSTDMAGLTVQSAQLPLIHNMPDGEYKNGSSRPDARLSKAHWSNPYQGRSNGGIPCFSEERSMERAAKRMAELQKRIDEKCSRTQTFGPFSEKEYFDRDCDIFYDDLDTQRQKVEEDFKKSFKSHNPYTNVSEKNHMNFIKSEEEDQMKRTRNLTPNTSQFETKLKRSRTEMFDSRKYSSWQAGSSADLKSHLNTWGEGDEHSQIYQAHTDLNRIAAGSSDRLIPPRPPVYSPDIPSTIPQPVPPTSHGTLFDQRNHHNPLTMLTREYSELLAGRIRASQSRIASKSQTNRTNLLRALQVNPLHCQPGLE